MAQILRTKKFASVSLIIIALLVGACDRVQSLIKPPGTTTTSIDLLNGTYPVDPVFRDFYNYLGGKEYLGPAISRLEKIGDVLSQYVEGGLMVYDPHAILGEKFHLKPLGLLFNIEEPPVPNPNRADEVYINGHIIYEQFLSLYRELGGARFVGLPITEVHYNSSKRRTEQYFENLGFYVLDDDQTKSVHLLAYGTYVCDQQCRYRQDPSNLPASRPFLTQPFNDEVARLGYDFVGHPLTEPYQTDGGMDEIIFDNLVMAYESKPEMKTIGPLGNFQIWLPQVLYTSLDESKEQMQEDSFSLMIPLVLTDETASSSKVWIQSIVKKIGIEEQRPVPSLDDPLMVFYPTDGDLGHNVPIYFANYIDLHGGLEVSGQPITEIIWMDDGIYRQCFENLCLEFNLTKPDGEQLSPVPLGEIYKEKYYTEPNEQFGKQSLEDIKLTIWEAKPYVGSNQSQFINVLIQENDAPIKNWEPEVVLRLPDNQEVSYYFPPSDENGKSSVRIPPISAPNGTLIPYRVCLKGVTGDTTCEENNYLIWNIPK